MYLLFGELDLHLVLGGNGYCGFCAGKSSKTNIAQCASNAPGLRYVVLNVNILVSQEYTSTFD